MFMTYAVRVLDGQKHRFLLGSYESEAEAKHMANCATLGNASYAYVKDSRGGTIFYLEAVDPATLYGQDTLRQDQCRPVSQAREE